MKSALACCSAIAALACSRGDAPAAAPAAPQLSKVVNAALAEIVARGNVVSGSGGSAGSVSSDALRGLLATLAEPRSAFREAALSDVKALGSGAIDELKIIVDDATASAGERTAAIEALTAFDDLPSLDALLSILETGKEPWMRAHAAWRLGAMTPDSGLPRMIARLKYETDSETVTWLADSLSRFGCYAGLDGLIVLCDRGAADEVRANAAQRGADIVARAGVSDLDQLARDWTSGELERRLPPKAPSDQLLHDTWVRIRQLGNWDLRTVDDSRFALSRLPIWVVGLLSRALRDENVYVRVHAAQCLERMGPRASSAAPALIESLRDPRVATGAAAALAAMRALEAAPELERVLESARDFELRVAAAAALGTIGTDSSIEPLRRAANASEIDLKQAALLALANLGHADEVAPRLFECMTLEGADHESAQRALEKWLSARAARGDDGITEVSTRWRALAPQDGAIEAADAVEQRRRKRCALIAHLFTR